MLLDFPARHPKSIIWARFHLFPSKSGRLWVQEIDGLGTADPGLADPLMSLTLRRQCVPPLPCKLVQVNYRGTSRIRNRHPVGPYSSPVPKDL
jgi:hypothetical protein